MNERLSSLWSWTRRFVPVSTLLCLAAVGFVVFSGENTVFNTIDYDRQIDSLRSELNAQTDTMLYYRGLNKRLASDPELMEQVVREQYSMKRDGEDVYIFKEANNEQD